MILFFAQTIIPFLAATATSWLYISPSFSYSFQSVLRDGRHKIIFDMETLTLTEKKNVFFLSLILSLQQLKIGKGSERC
jgi:hypothetical protein